MKLWEQPCASSILAIFPSWL